MPIIQERVRALSSSDRAIYETIAERFEEGWAASADESPDIAAYLIVEEPVRTLALIQLVKCDLELRRKRGEARKVEDYLMSFPALGDDREAVLDLITWEYRLSRSPMEEFESRFPALANEFRAAALKLGDLKPWVPPKEYEEPALIGVGGLGVVYRARHRRRDRVEALKVVNFRFKNEVAASKVRDRVARLRQEIPAAARLNHPNIVQLYSDGESDGRPYFAMEYCAGGSLQDRLDRGPMPPREAAAVVRTLAQAMAAVHAFGLIHRDLKPGNILFGENGDPKIADFGLALPVTAAASAPGGIAGTPAYMAPEQIDPARGDVGPATDVYGLGAVLYHCLTGRAPFTRTDGCAIMAISLQTDPMAPRTVCPTVSRDLNAICCKCLSKDPRVRYGTAGALADDLARFIRGAPVQARRQPPVRHALHWFRINPRKSIAAALVLALGLLLFKFRTDSQAAELTLSQQRQKAAEEIAESERSRASVERKGIHDARVHVARELARRGDWQTALEEFERAIADEQPDACRLRVERLPGYFAVNDTAALERELADLKQVDQPELAPQVKLMLGAWLLCDSDRLPAGHNLVVEALQERQSLFFQGGRTFRGSDRGERNRANDRPFEKSRSGGPVPFPRGQFIGDDRGGRWRPRRSDSASANAAWRISRLADARFRRRPGGLPRRRPRRHRAGAWQHW